MASSSQEIDDKIDAVIDLLDLRVATSQKASAARQGRIDAQGKLIAIRHKEYVDQESPIINPAKVTPTEDIYYMQIKALEAEIAAAAREVAAFEREDDDIGRRIKELEDWLEERGIDAQTGDTRE